MNLIPICAAVKKLFPKTPARVLAQAALEGKAVGREFVITIDLEEGITTLTIQDEGTISVHVSKTVTYTTIGKAYIHLEELV